MGQTLPVPPPGFDELTIEEQIEYVQALWDRIADTADQLAMPEWQSRLLNERLAAERANPEAGRPADEVFERLFERHRPES